MQADWRRSCTYGRAPNAIDISQGSLTCPSYTDTGPPFLYGDSDTPPHLVAFYDHAGDTEVHILDLTPRALTGGGGGFEFNKFLWGLKGGRGAYVYIA